MDTITPALKPALPAKDFLPPRMLAQLDDLHPADLPDLSGPEDASVTVLVEDRDGDNRPVWSYSGITATRTRDGVLRHAATGFGFPGFEVEELEAEVIPGWEGKGVLEALSAREDGFMLGWMLTIQASDLPAGHDKKLLFRHRLGQFDFDLPTDLLEWAWPQ